jgi:hypothetical protein
MRGAVTMTNEPLSVDPKMVERLLREGSIPVTRALALAPPACRGKGRTVSTLIRWIMEGKRGVRLEGFFGADKCWWTSAGALARFFARLTEMKLAGRRQRPTSACEDAADLRDRQRRAAIAMAEIRGLARQTRAAR